MTAKELPECWCEDDNACDHSLHMNLAVRNEVGVSLREVDAVINELPPAVAQVLYQKLIKVINEETAKSYVAMKEMCGDDGKVKRLMDSQVLT